MTSRSAVRMARLVLLCGLPGTGKTTTARRLAAELPAVRMSPDEWIVALDVDLYDEQFRRRVEALQWDLTEALLQLGQNVVIEWGLWTRAQRDELRKRATDLGATVELRHLDAPIDVLWERIATRNDTRPARSTRIERRHLDEWAARFEAPTADELAVHEVPPTD
jgi:predicted kinase